MSPAHVTVSSQSALALEADVVVFGIRQIDGEAAFVSSVPAEIEALTASLKAIGCTGARDELLRLPAPAGLAKSIALIGLGSGELTANSLRYAAGSALRQLNGVDSVALALPADDDAAVSAIAEGAAIGAYSYTASRGLSLAKAKAPASTITIVTDAELTAGGLRRAEIMAEAISSARDLINAPADVIHPESLAERAIAACAGLGSVTTTVLGVTELLEGGYGGLIGVGKGSARGPRLVRVDYAPDGARKHLALVGKGITFDTGGLSLKPAGSMVGMKFDMAGAASVLSVVIAAARLELPIHLTAWLCLAENMVSAESIRPGDVITTRNGTTVEVLNTDAEGRLVLADGLAAALEETPDAVIDIATLTGAAITALGNRYSAVMGDDQLVDELLSSSENAGEKLWKMPLAEELRAALNSDIADIANARMGNPAGGMLLAGVFLQDIVTASTQGKPTKWAHLDIAGTANNSAGGFGYTGKGATGACIRTLVTLAEDLSQA